MKVLRSFLGRVSRLTEKAGVGGRRGGSAELLSEKAAVECRQQGNPDTHQGVLLGPWGPLWAPGVRPLQMPEQPLNGGDREADR